MPKIVALPAQFDFIGEVGSPYNQWAVGSCVAASLAKAMEFRVTEVAQQDIIESIRWIYSQRANAPSEGMEPRDGLSILKNTGEASEAECPYNEGLSADSKCTSPAIVADASRYKIKNYARIYSLVDAKQALYQLGPVVLAIPVYSNWNDANVDLTGDIPDPPQGETATEGHQVFLVGWNDAVKRFIFINSWNDEFGLESTYGVGFGTISYSYVQGALDQSLGEMWTFLFDSVSPSPEPQPQPQPSPTQCYANFITDLANWSGQVDQVLINAIYNLINCLTQSGQTLTAQQAAQLFGAILDKANGKGVTGLKPSDYRGMFALVTLIITAAVGLIASVIPAALPIFTFFSGLTTSEAKDYFEAKRAK
jgi:hypothetical protein